MAVKVNKVPSFGGIDKENDLARVAEGDTVGALDVGHETINGNTSNAIQPDKGNVFGYETDVPIAQNKQWRFYFDYSDSLTGGYFIKVYLVTPAGISVQINNPPLVPSSYAQAVTYITNMWQSVFATTVYTHPTLGSINSVFLATGYSIVFVQTGPTKGFYTLTPNAVSLGLDYGFEISSFLNTATAQPIIVEEARSVDLVHPMVECASKEIDGDKFCIWTNGYQMPTEIGLVISSLTNLGTAIRVNFTNPTNISTLGFTTIKISGSNSGSYANGTWPCVAIGANSLLLSGSTFIANGAGGGIGTIWSESLGEIGVAQKNLNTDSWLYTRLLRTKEIPLRVNKQVSFPVGERNNTKASLYWTDDNIQPKVFYYTGIYIQDGAINSVSSDGEYQYGSIGIETNLIIGNSTFNLSYIEQLQSGGALKARNHFYAFQMVDASGNTSPVSVPINPVNVYTESDSIGNGIKILGNESGTVTSKANKLLLSNIVPGLFTKVRLIDVTYNGISYLVESGGDYDLTPDQTELQIIHTGVGQTAVSYDTYLQVAQSYATAKSIDATRNHLILTNLTGFDYPDLSPWASQLQHRIEREEITGTDFYYQTNNYYGVRIVTGEYQDPNNVHRKTGYMLNDVYRFAVVVKWKISGELSDPFWIDDIAITQWATNSTLQNIAVTLPNRRISSAITDYALTVADINKPDSSNPYVYSVSFDLNLDFIVDGVRVFDLIDEVQIWRAECKPEILASGGLALMCVASYPTARSPNPALSETLTLNGEVMLGGVPTQYQTSVDKIPYGGSQPIGIITDKPLAGSMYYGDYFIGNSKVGTKLSGDILLNYGQPSGVHTLPNALTVPAGISMLRYSYMKEFDARISGFTLQQIPVVDLFTVLEGGASEITGPLPFGTTVFVEKHLGFIAPTDATYNETYNIITTEVVVSGTPTIVPPFVNGNTIDFLNPTSPTPPDYGFRQFQYYRPFNYVPSQTNPDLGKYGRLDSTEYQTTGAIFKVSDYVFGVTNTVKVYGGDTMTQKMYFRNVRPVAIGSNINGGDASTIGGCQGFSCYGQNRNNFQMRNSDPSTPQGSFPAIPFKEWMGTNKSFDFFYNKEYGISNLSKSLIGFSPIGGVEDFPVRIAFSGLKIMNSLTDGYRNFAPLDFKDLELVNGEIVVHFTVNGELITLQWSNLQRQFFNETGVLQAIGNGTVNIGDGEPMARSGNVLTQFGTRNKFGCTLGKSQSGDQVLYFPDASQKTIMRFGADGLKDLCLIGNIKGWFEQNCTWVFNKDNPLGGEGIVTVWNQQKREVIFTFRGKRESPLWVSSANYVVGNYVHIEPQVFSTFSETGEIYVAIQPSNNIQPEVTQGWTSYWRRVPHTDPEYWNEYTLVFNELRNKFTKYSTPIVRYYAPFRNTFLSGYPAWGNGLFPTSTDVSRMYEHNKGKFLQWYDDKLISEGYIDLLFNKDDMWIKQYQALMFNCKVIPYKLQIFTKQHETYALPSDFEELLSLWNVKIKCDILTAPNGTNEENTSLLNGQYIIIRFYFKPDEEQVLVETALKYIGLYQVYNQ